MLLTTFVIVGILFFSIGAKANLLEEANTLFIALVVSGMYLLWFGYGVAFEMRWNGQTPGKRFVKIRVVQQNGAPIDARAACIRNLLAVADFLPAFQMLGALLILLTANRQRLGDLTAGTIVVRERAAGAGPESGRMTCRRLAVWYKRSAPTRHPWDCAVPSRPRREMRPRWNYF